MKKIILTIAFIASGLVASAQVGIGNTDPKVSLQVDKSADAAKADGVLVPRVTVAELNTKAATYGADQNGSLVFITAITGAANETSNVTATGFHYYNSTTDKWVAVGGGGAAPAYESIRGNRVLVQSATPYVAAANDFLIYSSHTAATAVTLPNLTSEGAAAIGRIISIYNNNTTGNVVVTALPTAVIVGTTVVPARQRTYMWVGNQWSHFVP